MSDVENKAEQPESDWVLVGSSTAAEDQPEQVEVGQEATEGADEATEEAESEDETELTIDGEAVPPTAEDDDEVQLPEDAPDWAKQLRQRQKELARENKALKQQQPVQQQQEQVSAVVEMPKPTLESCNWDESAYSDQMDKWAENQVAVKAKKVEAELAAKKQADELQSMQSAYVERRAAVMKQAPDYESAEKSFAGVIGEQAQVLVLKYAKDPAAIVLAAGRNKSLLNELQQLQNDPLALAAKIGELNRTATFAPKPKQQFKAEPTIKAQNTKPQSAQDAKFSNMFPDAKFS